MNKEKNMDKYISCKIYDNYFFTKEIKSVKNELEYAVCSTCLWYRLAALRK